MKRIEFIAPVEAMRGNLSGAQKLQYPTDNQGAYEGPVGSINYARNYSPRFVGAKRAKDGHKYFSVRTKTANHLTAKAKTAMALMGGTGAIVASILRSKSQTIYTNLHAAWVKAQEMGDYRSFRQFLSDYVRQMLANKAASIHVQISTIGQDIDNPWNTTKENPNVSVSQAVLIKFWTELAANGILFHVGSQTGIAKRGMMWSELTENTNMNILDVQIVEDSQSREVAGIGSSFILNNGGLVLATNNIFDDVEYTLSEEEPQG